MAFKTKRERYAYVKGIRKGMSGGKPYGRKKKRRKSRSGKKLPAGAYNSRGRINENLVDDRHGAVVFFAGNDFDYDSRGRIKGAWIDGRFEPD